ncbi:hypothetical protein RI844_11595 [Thalassotalea fonticola]|uniref:Alpha-L-arabinofuranosidase 1 catalytic domain-containing protein n=1 Tax=Thalassotalea fonticola TaxID=3065649 RepID=A0ABZ0GJR6_9GAMM|nr:hypothetical protein RI844_11595 [Colwelliaceae bacterium S1-1]
MLRKHLRVMALVLPSLLLCQQSQAQEYISIDHSKVLKTQAAPPIGENLTFLLDSDKHMPRTVSTKERAKEMKLSILRFPYGHMADNYLFTDAPFSDGVEGLTPRVASIGTSPGNLYWAVDDNGYFKNSVDFDEYISYTDKTGAEPLIVVNMLSYDEDNYPDTVVSFADLKQHAVEWVKYANITRGYKVKYWQLGNEVKAHTDKDTYFSHFVEVAQAMKAVDPSIQIGFGEDGRSNWVKQALADPLVSAHIDFISPHQYLHGAAWSETYEDWRDHNGSVIPKIDLLQGYADTSSSHKDVPMIVTEYGVTGGNYAERDPTGLHFFYTAADKAYLGVATDGLQLTKLASVTSVNRLINIEMFDDSWFGLKLNHDSSGYIKADNDTLSPITIDGLATQDGSKWRLRENAKKYYLESKQHPGFYLSYDANSARFQLGTEDMLMAEQFDLRLPQQVLGKANICFPSDTPRMLFSLANKKFVGLKADNTLVADAYRSESHSYQFIMTEAEEKYGINAVTLHSPEQAGFISRDPLNAANPVTLSSESILANGLWIFHPKADFFRLEAYNNPGSYLRVNSDGSLSADGIAANIGTRFTHNDLPEPNPEPAAQIPEGNYGNDLWKSLIFAEMSLTANQHKNLTHLIHWNTHTPFDGKYGGYHHEANSLENTDENNLTPVGQVLKMINHHSLPNILNLNAIQGKVRVFASSAPSTGEVSIILLNKNNQAEDINISLTDYQPSSIYSRWVYTGTSPEDEYPIVLQDDNGSLGKVTITGNTVTTTLEPVSLTVIRLQDPSIAIAPNDQTIVLKSLHSEQYLGLNNSSTDPLLTSTQVNANREAYFVTLGSLFKVNTLADGFVQLASYGGTTTEMIRYFSAAQQALQAEVNASDYSQWQWQLNSSGNVLLSAKNYPTKHMRTSAANDYKVDRDGSKGTWSQFSWQSLPDAPIGKEVWIRSAINDELLYVDGANNLLADGKLVADANAHFFSVERLSGDYVALKSSLTGQYIKSGANTSSMVAVDGENNDNLDLATLFKVKLVDGLVLFESAIFPTNHLTVAIDTDQTLNTTGNEVGWAQFYWGER